MEVKIKETLTHNGYTLNTVYRNGSAIAHVVSGSGDAKTYPVSDDPADTAFSEARAQFKSLSGWSNHG